MPATLPITRTWTVPASGSALLSDIISNIDYRWVTYVHIRAGRNNARDIFWADSGGQDGGYLGPGEAGTVGDEYGSSQMLGFRFKGTAGDKLYLTIGISLGNTVLG